MTDLKPKRARSEEPWMAPAAQLMVAEGLSIREACTRLEVPKNSTELDLTFRSKTFQKILRVERNRFYTDIARDPERTKATAIGQLLVCIERLMETADYEKAAESLLKLGRLENWLTNEGPVAVLGLSSKDINELREQIKQAGSGQSRTSHVDA